MSKYDNLDARSELEQTIYKDLMIALNKRSMNVNHMGTEERHAPGGQPDIIAFNHDIVITFEPTKSQGAAQDREFNSIKDHLYNVKATYGSRKCYCVFISPETSSRMLDSIRDHNFQRANENIADLKIIPICFSTLELWTKKLIESEKQFYPVNLFIQLFDHYTEFIDDLRIKKLFNNVIFPGDHLLADNISKEEKQRDNKTLELLVKDLALMEKYMRENGIAVGHSAIDTLIYIVFLKLYEEKREQNGITNRLRSQEAFEKYIQDGVDTPTRNAKRAIHKLFNDIKHEREFIETRMFTENDNLLDSVNDDFIINYVLPKLSGYTFVGTQVDALGAVYEVLALRAEKDVKVGQFFTPENVVNFMVDLADLNYNDVVLDPACGTGRFLIHSMTNMLNKLQRSDARDKNNLKDNIFRKQLYGSDIDPRIAKIAKMNMWIHGDGKSNILGGTDYNGLTLHKQLINDRDTFDNAFDVVLTNPPLGELNYQVIPFVDKEDSNSPENDLKVLIKKLERIPILPFKNLTEEKIKIIQDRLEGYKNDLDELNKMLMVLEKHDIVKEWLEISILEKNTKNKKRIKELEATSIIVEYKKVLSSIGSKTKTILQNEEKLQEQITNNRIGNIEMEITGNKMKGGAMFSASIWHYLKDVSYPDAHSEWQGGKMLTILDEGILNTDDYKDVRDFLRSHFYIKAVISLSRDTFVPISKTATKTSILYAIKKTDLHAIQKEPIFYAHVENVGLDTKGKVCNNDFDQILEKYKEFKSKVLSSYKDGQFNKELFLKNEFIGGTI